MKNDYRHNPDGSTTIFINSPKYGTKEALIDTDDFEKVSKYPLTWMLHVDHSVKSRLALYSHIRIPHPDGGVYINPTTGYITKRSTMRVLHHVVKAKPAKGYVTDHINGNGLDNRKENLRFVTIAVNNQNRRKQFNNTNGYVGVFQNRKNQINWYAHIHISTNNSRRIHLGTFQTIEEAAQAYDLAVVEHRKIVSPERQLNFPEKLEEYKALLATKNKCEDKKNKKQ